MTAQTRKLSEAPDENLLACLRVLERKMGLVLTLVCTILRRVSVR
jgi:DASH complex subunit DAD3